VPTGWLPDGLGVASGWLDQGRAGWINSCNRAVRNVLARGPENLNCLLGQAGMPRLDLVCQAPVGPGRPTEASSTRPVQRAGWEIIPCSLHDCGGRVLHFAHETAGDRNRGFQPVPVFCVPRSCVGARQVVDERGIAGPPKAATRNFMQCSLSRSTSGTVQAEHHDQTPKRCLSCPACSVLEMEEMT
jgi:hypothetical protein